MASTAEIMATTVDSARAGVVTVLRSHPHLETEAALGRAVEVVSHYAGPAYGRFELEADMASMRAEDLHNFIAPSLEYFTDAGRVSLLRGCLHVGCADGAISPSAYQAALDVAAGLAIEESMAKRVIQGFLDTQEPTVDLTENH